MIAWYPGGLPDPGDPRTVPVGPGIGSITDPTKLAEEYGGALAVVLGTARVSPCHVLYWGPPIAWSGGRTSGDIFYIADPSSNPPLLRTYVGTVNAAVYGICEAPITSIKTLYHPHFGLGLAPNNNLIFSPRPGSSQEIITADDGTVQAWGGYAGTAAEGMGHKGTAQIRMTHCFSAENGLPRIFDAEVEGYGAGASGESDTGDAHPADILVYLLTNTKNGLGLPSTFVNVETGLTGTAADSYRRYCSARGWYLSAAIIERTAVTDLIENLLLATDSALVLIDGKMTAVPYGDQIITRSTFTYDPITGAHPGTAGAPVTIDNAELLHEEGSPPLEVERRQEKDIFGVWPVEYIDRAALYKKITREYIDPVWTSQYGARRSDPIPLRWVMTPAHAGWVTYALAQRAIYQRNKYRFRLGPRWSLLTPMDLLSLSETQLGLSALRVRVMSIEEDEDGRLLVEAIEWPSATAEPIDLTPQTADGIASTNWRPVPGAPTIGVAPGGGNLFKNARLYDATGAYAPWSVYNNTQGSEPSTITGYATGGPDGGSYQRHAWTGTNTSTKGFYYSGSPSVQAMLRHDVSYVFSWYARAGTAQSFGMETAWNNAPSEIEAISTPPLATYWQRYAFRLKWDTGATIDVNAFLTILNGASMTGYIEIACAQLEEGSIPTGWQRNADETQATADLKVRTFAQATTPTASSVGDLWVDTDDGNRLYRCTALPSTWQDVRDGTIATAQSTADGKNTIFHQTSPPTANAVGDLWIDTDDNNRLYVCTGLPNTWTDARDATIATAQATADGKNKFSAGANPHSPAAAGDVWFNGDTTTNCPDSNCLGHTLDGSGVPNVGSYPHRKLWWVHRYTGSAWVDAKGQEQLIAADIVAGQVTTAKLVVAGVDMSKLTGSDLSNLFPNPSSELPPPTGADTSQFEWAKRYNAGANARSGSWVRRLGPGADIIGVYVPASPGDCFHVEAWARYESAGGDGRVALYWCPTFGSLSGATAVYGNLVNSGTYTLSGISAQGANAAPAGTNAAFLSLQSAHDYMYFDSLFACRMVNGDSLLDGSVTTVKIADYAVDTSKLSSDAVGEDNIVDAAVTDVKVNVVTPTPSASSGWAFTVSAIRRIANLVVGYAEVTANASTTWTSVFTLPTGSRPTTTLNYIPCTIRTAGGTYYPAIAVIDTNGLVSCFANDNGSNYFGLTNAGSGDKLFIAFAFPVL